MRWTDNTKEIKNEIWTYSTKEKEKTKKWNINGHKYYYLFKLGSKTQNLKPRSMNTIQNEINRWTQYETQHQKVRKKRNNQNRAKKKRKKLLYKKKNKKKIVNKMRWTDEHKKTEENESKNKTKKQIVDERKKWKLVLRNSDTGKKTHSKWKEKWKNLVVRNPDTKNTIKRKNKKE